MRPVGLYGCLMRRLIDGGDRVCRGGGTMSRYDALFASAPLNRTAAVVTAGGVADDELTPEQRRQNLVSMLHRIEAALSTCKGDPEKRKKYIALKIKIQTSITEAKSLMSQHPGSQPTFASHFVECAKQTLPPALFKSLRTMAWAKVDAENAKGESK